MCLIICVDFKSFVPGQSAEVWIKTKLLTQHNFFQDFSIRTFARRRCATSLKRLETRAFFKRGGAMEQDFHVTRLLPRLLTQQNIERRRAQGIGFESCASWSLRDTSEKTRGVFVVVTPTSLS